jgi:hypothetical protein
MKRVLYLNSNNAIKTSSTGSVSSVKTIVLTSSGIGYTSIPTASFAGGNPTTAAVATCILNPTTLNTPTITAAGSGYTGTPVVTATNLGTGFISSITPFLTATTLASITVNSGGNYSTAPTGIIFSGGGGSGATGTINMTGSAITSITINNAGSGYTSTPTITITGGVVVTAAVLTPILTATTLASISVSINSNFTNAVPTLTITAGKQNDGSTSFGGSGATATVSLNPTTLYSFNITNYGAGFSSAPAITISGGGASVQATALTFLSEVSKNYTFTWNIPEINIYELGEVQVGSIASMNASATSIYTFRLNNLLTLSNNCYSSDGGQPILFSLLLNNYNSMFRDDFGIYLSPQSISTISISTSDDMYQRDVGISNNVSFVLCLVITDNQINLDEIGSPYQDAKDEIKNRVIR